MRQTSKAFLVACVIAATPNLTRAQTAVSGTIMHIFCTAPGFLDTGLDYAARLKVVSRCAARASSGLR